MIRTGLALLLIVWFAALATAAETTTKPEPTDSGTAAETAPAGNRCADGELRVAGIACGIPKALRQMTDLWEGSEIKNSWIGSWIERNPARGCLLSFSLEDRSSWMIAGLILAVDLILAAVLRKDVERCANTLEANPGTALLAALPFCLALPLVGALLVVSGVGALMLPFLALAVAALAFFGRIVSAASIGRLMVRGLKKGGRGPTSLAVALGGALCVLLYAVPGMALVLWIFVGWIGFGAVVLHIAVDMRICGEIPKAGESKSSEPSSVPSRTPASHVLTTVPQLGSAVVMHGSPSPLAVLGNLPVRPAAQSPQTSTIAPASETVRAGFWQRSIALGIDAFLVCSLCGIAASTLPSSLRPGSVHALLLFALYSGLAWRFFGATVGGTVCALRVNSLDGRPLGWGMIAVRLLGGLLSLASGGLGFLWIALYPGRQSWQDRIAGTEVVVSPRR